MTITQSISNRVKYGDLSNIRRSSYFYQNNSDSYNIRGTLEANLLQPKATDVASDTDIPFLFTEDSVNFSNISKRAGGVKVSKISAVASSSLGAVSLSDVGNFDGIANYLRGGLVVGIPSAKVSSYGKKNILNLTATLVASGSNVQIKEY